MSRLLCFIDVVSLRADIHSSLNVYPFLNLPECTYAHGEEELQMTKLWDLHEAGLVDKDTFRIKPCFTWISTGSW